MHWMEIEERQQLAEELAARGLCLEEGREWFEVGMVEVTEEGPPKPSARRDATGQSIVRTHLTAKGATA